MAGVGRTAPRDLGIEAELGAAPYRFDFFHALRLLERLHADKPRLGTAKRAEDDPIRLGQKPFLHFPPAQLQDFEPGDGATPARLWTYVLGMFGPNGPLPLHLTTHALERLERHHDPTLVRFVDILHHRMLSLFYRAWAQAQPAVEYDRPASDRFALYVGALCGLGMPSLRQRDVVSDEFKLHHVGALAQQTRPPAVLAALVGDYFDVPAAVQEFVGGWLEFPVAQRCRLGARRISSRLGRGAVVGVRSYQCQHRFRLHIGPIDLAGYRRLLPGGDWLPACVALVRLAVGDELEWDLRLILTQNEVPNARLDGKARLGWTTWLLARRRSAPAGDLVLGGLVARAN